MALTPSELKLTQLMDQNVDSFDDYFESNADMPVATQQGRGGIQVAKTKGNPTFSAQFDISATVKYFTLNGGVYTGVAYAALNAGLQSPLPAIFFGWNDWKAGYVKNLAQFNTNPNWTKGRPFIYGSTSNDILNPLPATLIASLTPGDMVQPWTSTLPGSGTTSLAFVIIHCSSVAYGTLLESLVSDKFVMNMIRYTVPDSTNASLGQYANSVFIYNQSLFGTFNTNDLSPNSFKKPEQQQQNLIDIPLKRGINKMVSLATFLNGDCGTFTWSTFVWTVAKF
jgi:hypothetical protein